MLLFVINDVWYIARVLVTFYISVDFVESDQMLFIPKGSYKIDIPLTFEVIGCP